VGDSAKTPNVTLIFFLSICFVCSFPVHVRNIVHSSTWFEDNKIRYTG